MAKYTRYTEEEKQWFKEYVYGHSYKEIKAEYERKFNKEITTKRISSYITRHGLTTGRTGRFKKGQVPHNKGQKGVRYKGSEKTWFKKGRKSPLAKPIGSERVSADGYKVIKISDDKWELKHRYLWEKEYGKLEEGEVVIFKDNNPLNITLENLAKVNRAELMKMNFNGFNKYKDELKETAINIVKLDLATERKIK